MSWWTELYDDALAQWMQHHAPEDAGPRTVRFLQAKAGLVPGTRVLDQGCGTGRLVPHLAAAGARVQGLDLMPGYIARARERAAAAGLDPDGFRVGDIGEATSRGPVDLVISWWTCLGYAPDDATNARPLRRAFESLVPGGTYAIDTLHTPGVLRGFVPETRSETPMDGGVAHLHRSSRLDVTGGVLHKRWHWTLPDGREREVHTQLRLYMPHEWIGMLRTAGFAEITAYGNLDGAPLGPDSPRLLLVARRPA
mgnify:CR=1 FL=1